MKIDFKIKDQLFKLLHIMNYGGILTDTYLLKQMSNIANNIRSMASREMVVYIRTSERQYSFVFKRKYREANEYCSNFYLGRNYN